MAGKGNPLVDKEKLKEAEGRFDPNLRDEGAGFFSTLFTAGSNLGTDALQEVAYIAQAVARPIDTGEAVLRVIAGYAQKALPDDWENYLPEDWATNKEYAEAINEFYAERYGSLEQAMDAFAEKPVSVALDAFAVKALLTTVSKQAAKRSIATTKMADTAKGTVMEGELASRAAAELKVAQELERTVKYEGKLVWDDALGAYVPESSVTKPAKIDAAEVAPLIDDIEAATPNNNPAIANVADDTGTPSAAQLARTEEIAYTSNQINRLDNEAANRGGLTPTEEAAYLQYWRTLEELTEGGIYDDASKAAVGLDADGMMAATRNQAQNPLELNEQVLGNQLRASEPIAFMDGTAQESIAATKAYNEAAIAASKEPISYKGTTVAIADDLEQAAAQDLVKRNKTFEDNALAARIAEVQQRTADANKLARDKQRMADDDIMAAATQADLFENGTAAAYEAYQASRLAALADESTALTKASETAIKAAPQGMLATTASTKLAKLADVEKKTTPKVASAPKPNKKVETAAIVTKAAELAAVADARGLKGDRASDGSFATYPTDIHPPAKQPEDFPKTKPAVPETTISRPGWIQGNTHAPNDGNWWSIDFDDDYWNTPAGVEESMGMYGRPIGSKHSWENSLYPQ